MQNSTIQRLPTSGLARKIRFVQVHASSARAVASAIRKHGEVGTSDLFILSDTAGSVFLRGAAKVNQNKLFSKMNFEH